MTGGATVAILGGDGAGKSTAVASLVGWLSETFDVSRTHLGKPPRSICTLTVSLLRRIKLLSSAVLDRVVPSRRARSAETSPPDLLLMLWWVCVARDRYRLYRRIRRQVALGRLVVCDRYPTRFIKGMDGPLIDGSATASRLIRLLQRLEASYYELIRPPDLLVLLRVDPEVAARRKTDEDAAYVRERCREVWELDLAEIDVRVVDANQPAPQVLADLRNVLWARL